MKEFKTTVFCPCCEKEEKFTNASCDELGWHTSCINGKGSFDIDIEEHLLPNGTTVRLADEHLYIIDGNNADDSENFSDINYYACPIEFTSEKIWSNHYIMIEATKFMGEDL